MSTVRETESPAVRRLHVFVLILAGTADVGDAAGAGRRRLDGDRRSVAAARARGRRRAGRCHAVALALHQRDQTLASGDLSAKAAGEIAVVRREEIRELFRVAAAERAGIARDKRLNRRGIIRRDRRRLLGEGGRGECENDDENMAA